MTDRETYRSRLLLALRVRDVPGPRIAEALAEVDSHVAETGEDPTDAFGSPTEYARRLRSALDPDAATGVRGFLRGLTWHHAVIAVLSLLGAGLLTHAVGALGAGTSRTLGLPTPAALALGLALLAAMVVLLVRVHRQERDPVLDPRTGADMVPQQPRWATALTFGYPVVMLVAVFVLGRTAG
jgi:hypothetical protein